MTGDKGIKVIDDETGNAFLVSSRSVEHEDSSAEINVGGGAFTLIPILCFLLTYLALSR